LGAWRYSCFNRRPGRVRRPLERPVAPCERRACGSPLDAARGAREPGGHDPCRPGRDPIV